MQRHSPLPVGTNLMGVHFKCMKWALKMSLRKWVLFSEKRKCWRKLVCAPELSLWDGNCIGHTLLCLFMRYVQVIVQAKCLCQFFWGHDCTKNVLKDLCRIVLFRKNLPGYCFVLLECDPQFLSNYSTVAFQSP